MRGRFERVMLWLGRLLRCAPPECASAETAEPAMPVPEHGKARKRRFPTSARKVRQLRRTLGISQREAGRRCGVKSSVIYDWEQGFGAPGAAEVAAITSGELRKEAPRG